MIETEGEELEANQVGRAFDPWQVESGPAGHLAGNHHGGQGRGGEQPNSAQPCQFISTASLAAATLQCVARGGARIAAQRGVRQGMCRSPGYPIETSAGLFKIWQPKLNAEPTWEDLPCPKLRLTLSTLSTPTM
jgi:hypothetical protein